MAKEERVQQAKKLVAEQLSNMIVNNLVEGNGFERFEKKMEKLYDYLEKASA